MEAEVRGMRKRGKARARYTKFKCSKKNKTEKSKGQFGQRLSRQSNRSRRQCIKVIAWLFFTAAISVAQSTGL
ncbi:hypothetical protein BDV41DRAFT_29351 [Aspergillus transmontanensis]|uniref:Uncharacterized protein n=1 Tax=Aspergillus transmontanensis TaxID=1034304 RepID=A0A5N6VHA8_9EURO|nr:hypothetical protein BDV41DRAFT_29351 [Aspergillus transmontanensis]